MNQNAFFFNKKLQKSISHVEKFNTLGKLTVLPQNFPYEGPESL